MENRELLEAAARAAGIEGRYESWTGQGLAEGIKWRHWRAWNPLTDDGDVFRLLLVLNEFEPYKSRGGFRVPPGITAEEARRAIVRAAAEIGRSISA